MATSSPAGRHRRARRLVRLVDLADGERARVARISEVAEHEAPQLLHILDQREIVPGVVVGVVDEIRGGVACCRPASERSGSITSTAWAVWVEAPQTA